MPTLFMRISVVAVLVLIAGELMARALIMSPSPQIYDSETGFSYAPHADVFSGVEGYARNHYNRLGLNNDEIGPKTRNWRILVVGDSYVEARQVPREENYASEAQRLDPRLEVINAGRDGLNAAAFPVVAQRLESQIAPDLTVVVLSQGRLDDFDAAKVVTTIDADGHVNGERYIVQERDRLKDGIARLLRQSALMTALGWKFQGRAAALAAQLSDLAGGLRAVFKYAATAAPSAPPTWRPVRVPVEDSLAFVLERMRVSTRLAVLYLPHLRYAPGGGVEQSPGSALAEDVVRRVAARLELPFHSAAGEFLSASRESGRPTQGHPNNDILDGHLNRIGHRALGAALVRLAIACLANDSAGSDFL